jgi:DNA-binding NtrC family response regulator
VQPLQLKQCRLTVLRGRSPRREHVFGGDVIRVGKAPENDVILEDDTVSRIHFELVRDGKGWLLRDLRSTNGTYLDGAEVQAAYVRAGAVVSAGDALLRVEPFEERIEIPPFAGERLGDLVGRSPAMRDAFALLARLGPTEVAVLVEGPAGSGKEAAARTLHALSRRKAGPFVRVDARATTATLESELLGTGGRPSAFERAAGGTLLLDELGELALELQPRLFRILEARELRREAAGRPIRVDARVVFATSRPIGPEVDRGRFRSELFARCASATVSLPPLRERREDVPLLAARFAEEAGQPPLLDDDLAVLAEHDWPGNVAELRDVVTRGLKLGRAGAFDATLPFRDLKERWSDDFERRYLVWLLGRAGGNISRAAREADMDRKYLHKLLRKHRIEPGVR